MKELYERIEQISEDLEKLESSSELKFEHMDE